RRRRVSAAGGPVEGAWGNREVPPTTREAAQRSAPRPRPPPPPPPPPDPPPPTPLGSPALHLPLPPTDRAGAPAIWAVILGAYVYFGLVAVGVHGGTAFVFAALAAFFIFLLVRLRGDDAPAD